MKNAHYIIISLFLFACSPAENQVPKTVEETSTEANQLLVNETPRVTRDSSINTVKPVTLKQTGTFSGSWFQIEYPENFKPSPTAPIATFGDYQFVETDEARFTSPDGTVEFFVFSPQWGGDPKDYLIQQENEKTVDQSEDKADANESFPVSHHWVTYEDKDGKYTRSYHSIMSESTHHVFGVKYTSRKMYERYKASYVAFKKSLQQFAD